MNNIETMLSKIYSLEAIKRQLHIWRLKINKIVFTNGCFDILHPGHIDYLSKAAEMGDLLIVGLNSDASVKKLKGNNRPYNNEKDRAFLLSSLFFVNAIVSFSEDTPYELIKSIKPDILVKGSDYTTGEIAGSEIVQQYGGEVKTIDFLNGYSTTGLEQKILNNNL